MLTTLVRILRSTAAAVPPHVLVATTTGLLLGIMEMLVRPPPEGAPLWLAGMLGALLGAQLGVLIGVFQAVAVELVRWLGERTNLWTWITRHTDTDREAPREPVVGLHAAIAAAIVTGVGVLGVLVVVFDAVLGASDSGVAPRLAMIAVVVGIGGGVFAIVLTQWLVRPVRWLDRRVTLPRPHNALGRYVCFVVVPVGLPLATILARDAAILGAYTVVLWVAVFLVFEGLLWFVAPRAARQALWTVGAVRVAAVVVAVVAATLALFASQPSANEIARKGVYSRVAVGTLRNITDVDRDGSSSLYGGGDCAPFSAALHPRTFDVPGNGIDENCDGADAEARSGQVMAVPTFLGDLSVAELEPRKYNIVWVIVDAARADHCHIHGYKPDTTPYLDELVKESLVFDNAYSQSSATMLSIPSMLTGLRPGGLDWVKRRRLSLHERHTTLAEHLEQAGYRTGIVADKYIKDYIGGALQGYDVVEDNWLDGSRMPWYRRNAAVATTLAIRILERGRWLNSETPFFLTVYSADPHHPYDRHGEGFPKLGSGKLGRYDSEIAFADRYTGMLVDYLRYNEIWDDTIFVFTADHGEEFGEHGGEKHAATCHEESTHVPLLVRIPGVEGRKITQRVALTDIVPTLLEVLGLDQGQMELDGQSLLVPVFQPDAVPPDRPIFCDVLSQTTKQGEFFRQSVRIGERALFHDRVAQTFAYYDTTNDRAELSDILQSSGEDDTIARMKELLDAELVSNLRELRLTGTGTAQDDDDD
jgi:arylsulfatase A-like enzyme